MAQLQKDFSSFALRIAFCVMFLAHGLTKLLVFTPVGTAIYFESLGLPGLFGYLTIIFEIGGGIFLLLGILTRFIALLTVIQMIVISYIHFPNGWSFSSPGGGWEYPAFMALVAFALFLLGNGRISLVPKKYRRLLM